MPEAYIYDAVRTPRGKGKSSGSLHEITALSLATQVLEQIRIRAARGWGVGGPGERGAQNQRQQQGDDQPPFD